MQVREVCQIIKRRMIGLILEGIYTIPGTNQGHLSPVLSLLKLAADSCEFTTDLGEIPVAFSRFAMGKQEDPHANNIFIVNDAPRLKISTKTTSGTNWDDEWHHARVVRNVGTGSIEVYFDDMDEPVMTAVDKTFTWGRVGVGSFDDTGNFDDVLVYGKRAQRP